MTTDSRLKGYGVRVTHPTLPLERTFCANCGTPRGWVSHESAHFIRANEVIVLCDGCERVLGLPPLAKANIPEFQGD